MIPPLVRSEPFLPFCPKFRYIKTQLQVPGGVLVFWGGGVQAAGS